MKGLLYKDWCLTWKYGKFLFAISGLIFVAGIFLGEEVAVLYFWYIFHECDYLSANTLFSSLTAFVLLISWGASLWILKRKDVA